jgi:hypothetical protein
MREERRKRYISDQQEHEQEKKPAPRTGGEHGFDLDVGFHDFISLL